MAVYHSDKCRIESLALYDKQLEKLNTPFSDIYVNTFFGRTHLIETGCKSGKPLLVFHGGNSTTAYNLLICRFLLDDFHVYAVDTVGHPGKSAETDISPRGYDYGKWASEVIDGLGFEKMLCFGGSFGGGILAKLMCYAPNKVEKAVLIVPSGINNAIPVSSAKMMLPLIQYRITKQEKYLIKTALFMALHREVIDEDTLDILRDSFENVKTKVGMPSNVDAKRMAGFHAPSLVIAGDRDCMFPASRVLPRARQILANCQTIELKGSGHMHILPEDVKRTIVEFLL